MKKILLAIGALVTAVIAIGIVFSNMILFIKKKTDEDIIKRETDNGHDVFESFEQMEKTAFVIPPLTGTT